MRGGRTAAGVGVLDVGDPTLEQLIEAQRRDGETATTLERELAAIHAAIARDRHLVGPDLPWLAREGMKDREPEAQRELRRVRMAMEARRLVMDALRERERDRLHGEYHERKGPLVRELAEALARAAAVNRDLSDLEFEESARTGDAVSIVSWAELLDETPTQESRLARWQRLIAAEGF